MPEEELAGFPVESDLATALSTKPDGVIVSNPTALHLDTAIPSAQQGAHLLLEKPISHSMERVDILAERWKSQAAGCWWVSNSGFTRPCRKPAIY